MLSDERALGECAASTGCGQFDALGNGRTAGFHISSLYSPVGWFSWGDAAKQFEQAQKNSSLLQVFVNTVLGETWTMLGEAPDWKALYDRREDLKTGIIPRGGLFLSFACTGSSSTRKPSTLSTLISSVVYSGIQWSG